MNNEAKSKGEKKTQSCVSCAPLKDAADKNLAEFNAIARASYPGTGLPDNKLDGLMSAGYWDCTSEQQWGLPKHCNEGIEITWLENGNLDFFCTTKNFEKFDLTQNSLTVTCPWQEHSIGNPSVEKSKLHWIILDISARKQNEKWKWPNWIILDKDDLDELAQYARYSTKCVFPINKNLTDAFTELSISIKKSDSIKFSLYAVLINRILLSLLEIYRSENVEKSDSSPTNEYAVKLFLEQLKDICHKPWSIEQMAQDCGLKPTRFAYYCKRITNSTPIDYLNELRLARAHEILSADPKASITELSLDCGFSSSQYFSTLFKAKYGMSPRDFKHNSKVVDILFDT